MSTPRTARVKLPARSSLRTATENSCPVTDDFAHRIRYPAVRAPRLRCTREGESKIAGSVTSPVRVHLIADRPCRASFSLQPVHGQRCVKYQGHSPCGATRPAFVNNRGRRAIVTERARDAQQVPI